MDYKDLQNQQKIAVSDQSEERIQRYMQTIKKLQDQNEQLRLAADKRDKGKNLVNYLVVFLILVMAGGFYFFNKKLQQYKRYEKSTV